MESNLSPAGRETTGDWIRDLPTEFQDVDEGILKAMMSLILRYFKQVRIAAGSHHRATSVRGVLEVQQRFSLFTDGDGDLDQRLNNDPAVRKLIVSDLTALVLLLSTGVQLFPPEPQRTFIKETNQIIEQASAIAHHHLERLPNCAPTNLVEFCNSIEDKISSRMDNLYIILPVIGHPVDEVEEKEPRQVAMIGVDERWRFPHSGNEGAPQSMSRLSSTHTPTGETSTSHGAENSWMSNSIPSEISAKQLSGSTDSHTHSSLFSHDNTHHSAHALTDSTSSYSPSEGADFGGERTDMNSTGASFMCKSCGTTFRQDHDRDTESISPFQLVRIWHSNGQDSNRYLALLDTGSSDSFICHEVVQEMKLGIGETETITVDAFDHTFRVNKGVKPKWQLEKRPHPKRHEDFVFFVRPKISGNIDLVLGRVALLELGITLCASKTALIAHAYHGDPSTQDEEQKRHKRLTRDVTASQTETRRRLEAEHAEMVAQKTAASNAANATNVMQQRNPTSRQNATGSTNNQSR